MSQGELTFAKCLNEQKEPMQGKIRGSRRIAHRPPNPGARPRIVHPVEDSGRPGFEVWEEKDGQLGSGGNGCVVVLQSKVSPPPGLGCPAQLRAVKIIPVNDERWKYYLRELYALIIFSEKKYCGLFVEFLGWYKFPDDRSLYIITEYCELGDLEKYLEAKKSISGPLPEHEVKDIAWQVLMALRIMHEEEFIHGDIKLKNILIVQFPPNRWKVKVCDLGLCKRVEQTAGSNGTTSRQHFSRGYLPPEKLAMLVNDEDIDGYKVDMWCLGELVFQALTGNPTFKNNRALKMWSETGQGYPDQLLLNFRISEDAMDFLHSLQAADPEQRPAAEEASRHHWWTGSNTRHTRGQLDLRQPGKSSHRPTLDVRSQSVIPDTSRLALRHRFYRDIDHTFSAPSLPPSATAHDNDVPPSNYASRLKLAEAHQGLHSLSLHQQRMPLASPSRPEYLEHGSPTEQRVNSQQQPPLRMIAHHRRSLPAIYKAPYGPQSPQQDADDESERRVPPSAYELSEQQRRRYESPRQANDRESSEQPYWRYESPYREYDFISPAPAPVAHDWASQPLKQDEPYPRGRPESIVLPVRARRYHPEQGGRTTQVAQNKAIDAIGPAVQVPTSTWHRNRGGSQEPMHPADAIAKLQASHDGNHQIPYYDEYDDVDRILDRQAQWREMERRGAERRETERIEAERREMERRQAERREEHNREIARRPGQEDKRREAERQENERREVENLLTYPHQLRGPAAQQASNFSYYGNDIPRVW